MALCLPQRQEAALVQTSQGCSNFLRRQDARREQDDRGARTQEKPLPLSGGPEQPRAAVTCLQMVLAVHLIPDSRFWIGKSSFSRRGRGTVLPRGNGQGYSCALA